MLRGALIVRLEPDHNPIHELPINRRLAYRLVARILPPSRAPSSQVRAPGSLDPLAETHRPTGGGTHQSVHFYWSTVASESSGGITPVTLYAICYRTYARSILTPRASTGWNPPLDTQ